MKLIIATLALMVVAATSAKNLGGYENLALASPPLKSENLLQRARSFIDHHWTQRRRGHFCYTLHSGDDPPLTANGYIEPAADGTWHIRFESREPASGQIIHRFDAVSFRYWGQYMYFHDQSGKNVGML